MIRPIRQNSMKSFLAACGIEDSFQLAVENQNATESKLRLLYQPFAVIGRDLRADVVLDHIDVSRRHVYLQAVNGRVFWIDLESRTGTRGEREPQRFGWLEGGRTFGVGPYVFRRFPGDGQTADKPDRNGLPRDIPLVARAYTHFAQTEVTLEFLNGPSQSMFKPVHRILSLIGSASGCKFRLTDPSVSRFHSSLLQTSAGLWIVDLLGQKGITVNDVPVRSSRLADGDIVRIGRYQIRIRCRPRVERSESKSYELGRAAYISKQTRRSRAPIDLTPTSWAPVVAPSRSDSIEGHKLSPLPISSLSIPSKADLVPSSPIFPVNLAQSEVTESILVPLVNQFGLMQQQMFDQFQQAMAMMVQMFGTMHRDQMEVIRAELDQLRELTEEFHALKDELARRTQDQAGALSGETKPDLAGFHRPAGTESARLAPPLAVAPTPAGNVGAIRISKSQAPLAASLSSKITGEQPSREPHPQVVQPSAYSPRSTSDPEHTARTNSLPSAKTGNTGPESESDRATVLWLHQRIMTLQHERENRWQKLLKLVPGVFSSQ
jgi:pSer/pThr/pTyr-binding forkhead associated (FHA) protein